MNKFDKEIRRLAKQSKCPTSKNYEIKIDNLLEDLGNETSSQTTKKAGSRPFFKLGIAACALTVICLVSVPVTAQIIDYVKQRMLSMSDSEIEEIADSNDEHNMTREHSIEGIIYSREMSEQEEKRYSELRDKYENEGAFPEGTLQIVDKLEDSENIQSLVYETYNKKLFLPEKELSDEELLEIIDYYHKSDYVMQNSDAAKELKEAHQKYQSDPYPDATDLSEEEAAAKATFYLETIYGLDFAAMDITTEFVESETPVSGNYADWEVTFKGADDFNYIINLSQNSGQISTLQVFKGGEFYGFIRPDAEMNETLYTSIYEQTKDILKSMYPSSEITQGLIAYTKTEDNKAKYGLLDIKLFTKDGYFYYFQYVLEEGIYDFLAVDQHEYDPYLDSSIEDYLVIPMDK
ncbi:MAG: hypothetical protein NC412_11260 [Roseburia sp.]|nr:hypothetical protein [Roseburia sp.]MCM1279825.1 hypothetical protein [Robinsoniella sp.]